MRIKPGDMIVGHPALEIRKLLQYDERFSFSTGSTITTIEEVLKVSISIATQIYQDLCKEGYIELVDASKPPNGEEILWYNTTKGNGLAHATARKPITRKTAEELVQKFLDRVKEINHLYN